MTAQQQAVKLVNKHLRVHNGKIHIAQSHAIITAKTIVKEYKKNLDHLFDTSEDVKHWEAVIKEIENL
jgi:hypothetical protein